MWRSGRIPQQANASSSPDSRLPARCAEKYLLRFGVGVRRHRYLRDHPTPLRQQHLAIALVIAPCEPTVASTTDNVMGRLAAVCGQPTARPIRHPRQPAPSARQRPDADADDRNPLVPRRRRQTVSPCEPMSASPPSPEQTDHSPRPAAGRAKSGHRISARRHYERSTPLPTIPSRPRSSSRRFSPGAGHGASVEVTPPEAPAEAPPAKPRA